MSYKAQIVKAEGLLKEAMLNADFLTLESLLHDQLSFAIPTGEVITKSQELDNYKSGRMKVYDIDIFSQEVNEIGDTITVAASVHLKGAYDTVLIDGKFKFIRVWKMTEGGPRIIAGSSTSIPEEGSI
ncbi:nuclear transport factor 2 family protein [Roseivirga sp. E12]|uniref:nuclear transport factor 2 family protein n=1 Tax=Roseivirga sp. E12 TaxID=2819237 RepID=UPI001ABD0057|nr:nuclear transport factor 2 family protein [Roseivirga sp. E12]